MKILHTFRRQPNRTPKAYSLVDVGRYMVKAVVVLVIPDTHEPQVVGYGTAETGDRDITGGRNEAEAVSQSVNAALTLAEDSAQKYIGQPIVPDDVIFAVAGRAVVGKLVTVRQTRERPSRPISVREFHDLRLKAERLLPGALAESAYEGGNWQPLAVSDAGMTLDGRLIVEGTGLTGRELTLSVFGVAAQSSALRALEVLAENLNLNIANVVTSPHALASVVPTADAVIMDVGFSGTDISVVRNDVLVATDWIPFGGHYFTQSLVQVADMTATEAREVKHEYSTGDLSAIQTENIYRFLRRPLRRWFDAVVDILELFAAGNPLPRRIFLTGAASQLLGLDRVLKFAPSLFEAVPEVAYFGRQSLPYVKDLTEEMNYTQMALALSLVIGLPE
jgi:cell division ATPase FtsA